MSSNNVLFIGRDESAIVDTGYASHASQTLELVEAALDARPLDRLLNTHLHSDHCGGNSALQQRFAAVHTAIPPGEAAAVLAWDEDALSYRTLAQQCPRFRFDALLEPGAEVRLGDLDWQIHAAKGHDPHSIILFEPGSRTLISADALWEKGFGIVFPELSGEPSFTDVSATLDLIESLGPVVVIPGHGAVFDQVSEALAAARSRLDVFARDPVRHARHALKALLMFSLLETRVISREDWNPLILGTKYLEVVRLRFFPARGAEELCAELLDELVRSGQVVIDASQIRIC